MDFEQARQKLKGLSDQQLEERFWQLSNEVVKPLVELAKTHTSPSIERSVLLRMGFNSLDAKAIVDKVHVHGLLGKGAGNVVFRYAKAKGVSLSEAGLSLAKLDDWKEVTSLFDRQGGAHK